MQQLKACWISAGVSSFIAGYLERATIDEYIYIDIEDQHPDSMRFIRDCEKALGKEVKILTPELKSVEEACRKVGYISFAHGAACTGMLKRNTRHRWESEHREYDITYVWGYDANETGRAERMNKANPDYKHQYPLIERGLTKQDAHAILSRLGIKRPVMYDMGYQNSNCIGCVHGGMGYWNKIRVDFPEVFASRAKMERDLGKTCLKGGLYLDELDPHAGRMQDEISQDCGIMCYLNLE